MTPFNNRQELAKIFGRYLDGSATPEEKRFVEAWYNSFENESNVLDQYSKTDQKHLESKMEEALRRHTGAELTPLARLSRVTVLTRAAAAAILIFSLAGAWFFFSKTEVVPSVGSTVETFPDLAPGSDRAILTLSDGSQIALDNVSKGMLARQGNTLIHKVEDGLISYTGEGTYAPGERHNTITAPAGGKYSVVLPDGSRVWLNSESSVTFPPSFPAGERLVRISGEVYFEIAKDIHRPFTVQVGNVPLIRVLGTHFNINAYQDEGKVATTLIEGSVEVLATTDNPGPVILKPGEQATFSDAGEIRVLDDINMEEIIAWKNGMFQFEKTDIGTVMRQIGRWYNVDVVYDGKVPERKFSGKISRQVNASEALDILQFTGLNFRIKTLPSGDKKGEIVVLPY